MVIVLGFPTMIQVQTEISLGQVETALEDLLRQGAQGVLSSGGYPLTDIISCVCGKSIGSFTIEEQLAVSRALHESDKVHNVPGYTTFWKI